jgi:ABC-type polysaccharide/polyol phosphate transport system ATPase subunit
MGGTISFDRVSMRFFLQHERPRSFQDRLVNFVHQRNGSSEEFWALRDVSFAVQPGETLGLVGENGSGKSTILKLATRILYPTSGQVMVNGKVSALIELGAGFHPDLTGRENIYLNGSILGFSRKQMARLFDEIVAFSELERFIDTPVKHYSSGMYMRLGFSVAVNVDPDILIIDEVLSVGDEAFKRKCMDRIMEFKRRGKTIIFVSHAMPSVEALCDRVIWLEHGVVRGEGEPEGVVTRYLDTQIHKEVAVLPEPATSTQSLDAGTGDPGTVPAHGAWVRDLAILSESRVARREFRTGDTLAVRIYYCLSVGAGTFVLSLRIQTCDGALIHSTTWLTESKAGGTNGESQSQCVEVEFPDLGLLDGEYWMASAIWPLGSAPPDFDGESWRQESFSVRGDERYGGIVLLPHKWREQIAELVVR